MSDDKVLDPNTIPVGALCLVAGGHLQRYCGRWGGSNGKPLTADSVLSFHAPSIGIPDPPTGYSARAADIVRVLDASQIEGLRKRAAGLRARNMEEEAAEVDIAIRELQAADA